jgi:hypothetical protein
MSYDFHLLKPVIDEDLSVTSRAIAYVPLTAQFDPKREALNQRIADALIARDPKLQIVLPSIASGAESRKASQDDPSATASPLRLVGAPLVFITLFHNQIRVELPFWYEGQEARDFFRNVWSYLEIISQATNYIVYDRQVGRSLNLSVDFQAVLECYNATVRFLNIRIPAPQQQDDGATAHSGAQSDA